MSAPTAVLFDVPGPKARVRNSTLGVVSVLLVGAFLAFVVYRLAVTGQFDGEVWEWILYENVQLVLLEGLVNTLRAFAAGAVLALAFGALFALGRLSDRTWLRGVSTAVVEFFRGVPLVVMMFIFYFGLPAAGITVSTYVAVVLGLTLYNGAVLAEVFRSGVLAVPRGQSESAYALGMRKSQVMREVLLPQALRSMLPTVISQLVVLLKDSALGFLILYPELLFQTRTLGNSGDLDRPLLPVAIVVAAVYITMCLLLTAAATYLERRTRRVSPVVEVVDTGA